MQTPTTRLRLADLPQNPSPDILVAKKSGVPNHPPRPTTRAMADGPSSSAASAALLGYFHHPTPTTLLGQRSPSMPAAFHPLTASSPRLSLDFLRINPNDFSLYDSHLGLLLLREDPTDGYFRRFVVCDPVSRRHVLFHPPLITPLYGGEIVGAAILSRDVSSGDPDGGLCFEAVCVVVEDNHPRAWVASFRDGQCIWTALPPSPNVTVGFNPYWFERICVHAAGSLYWHICNYQSALALDAATIEFSYLRAPAMMWDPPKRTFYKYRFGEMPDDGQLCIASMEHDVLLLCVRSKEPGNDHGWELVRQDDMTVVLDQIPGMTRNPLVRTWIFLSDIDAGRTGKVFITSGGFGRFSYDMNTGKLEKLETEDGLDFGRNIFAYSAPPSCSH